MTNGDRIRSMTDEELARFRFIGKRFCNIVKCEEHEGSCYLCALDFLKEKYNGTNNTDQTET